MAEYMATRNLLHILQFSWKAYLFLYNFINWLWHRVFHHHELYLFSILLAPPTFKYIRYASFMYYIAAPWPFAADQTIDCSNLFKINESEALRIAWPTFTSFTSADATVIICPGPILPARACIVQDTYCRHTSVEFLSFLKSVQLNNMCKDYKGALF